MGPCHYGGEGGIRTLGTNEGSLDFTRLIIS